MSAQTGLAALLLISSASAFAPSFTAHVVAPSQLWIRPSTRPQCFLNARPEPTVAPEKKRSSRPHPPAAADAPAAEAAEAAEADGDRLQGGLLMLVVALLWGSNFPAVKATLSAGLPGSAAGAMRFSVAAVALLPFLGGKGSLPRDLVVGGLECGGWLALGYIAQALALQDLPAGAVAFLASLQVVFVPLLLTFTGGAFSARLALAAALCVSGVGLLEAGGLQPDALGDVDAGGPAMLGPTLLALLQPVGFGTSYLRIEALMSRFPEYGLQLSSLQLLSNAAIAIAWCAADALLLGGGAGGGGFDLSALHQPAVVAGVLYTGLVSTALTVLLQTRALSMLPATDSSVIVATEPLWAAGFASLLLGEVLDPAAQCGGALILLGCLSNAVLPDDLGLGAAEEDAAGRLH